MLIFFVALSSAGVWLWTEITYHRASILVDRILSGKSPGTKALIGVLSALSGSQHEILPGKHLYYESILAIAASDISELPKATRLQWLKQARKGLIVALMREPANSHAWVHLAYITWLFNGPGKNVVNALRMSVYTSPANSQLLAWRLKLAGLNRDFWDPSFKDLVSRQIILTWRHSPKALAEIAGESHLGNLVRETLSKDPAEMIRF
jgi:hypothetical protein